MADKNMERMFEEWAGNKPVEFPNMDKDPVSFWCWKAWQKATEIEREACARECESQTEGFAATSTWDEAALSCARAIRARKVGDGDTAEPNCDRSECGDFKPGPCDHPDCPAIGKAHDDMIAMEDAQGKKFALKFNSTHPQHGWIFYDNHGQWVTLRRALPHEIERAKGILEMRQVLAGVPCKA